MNILARVAAKDIRTTTARNLRLVEEQTGGLTWSVPSWRIKKRLLEREPVVPMVDNWRLQYLGKLLQRRASMLYQGMEGCEEVELLQGLIDSLCTN